MNTDEHRKFTEWFESEDFCHDYELGAHAKECVYRAWLARANEDAGQTQARALDNANP